MHDGPRAAGRRAAGRRGVDHAGRRRGSIVGMADELLDITCPRCGTPSRARFYGPCDECRGELRATLGGEQHELEAAAYEPKMNVTPNAVALKE